MPSATRQNDTRFGPTEPLLSLAMIVRDGGQFLASLLDQARPWVDEIVIGDTGSRDDSPNIARSAGAEVLTVTWRDDFAAARNQVLAACRGEWILVLDADETLAEADWPRLRRWVEGCRDSGTLCGARFLTRNYVRSPFGNRDWQPLPDPDPSGLTSGPPATGFVPSAKVRLFPKRPGLRFQGCIHETVDGCLSETGLPIEDVPWPIHHFGLLQVDPGKALRYLALARRKTRDQPHDPSTWSELADCAIAAGDLDEALAAIDRALILDPGHPGMRLTAGWLLKEAGQLAQADIQLAAVAGNQGVTDGELAEASHLRAQIALDRDNPQAAASLLGVALRLSPRNGHYLNTLGVFNLQIGRGEQARQALEKARATLPDRPEPCLNLGLMYEAAGHPEQAAGHLRQALRLDSSCQAAAAALQRLGVPI